MALYPIASDLSYFVLEQRRRLGELSAPELNQANRRANTPLSTDDVFLREWRARQSRNDAQPVEDFAGVRGER